jgi:hypothetical protein
VPLRSALQGNFARPVAQTSVAAPLVVGGVVGAPDQATAWCEGTDAHIVDRWARLLLYLLGELTDVNECICGNRTRFYMNANPKIALSAIALAALVVGPAVAKPRSHAPVYDNGYHNGYHNGRVVVGGRLVGADPDPNIRIQIRRDWNWWEE